MRSSRGPGAGEPSGIRDRIVLILAVIAVATLAVGEYTTTRDATAETGTAKDAAIAALEERVSDLEVEIDTLRHECCC